MTAKRPSARITTRARDVAPGAQVLDNLVAGHLARVRRIAVRLAPRAGGVDRDAARCTCAAGGPGGRRGRCASARAARQLARDLAAHEHEQPVALLEPGRAARQQRLVAAHDQRDERVARQPEVAQPRARRGVARAGSTCSTTSPPSSRTRADLEDPRRLRRLVGRHAEPPRHRLDRRALEQRREQHREEHDVEELLAVRRRRRSRGTSRARPAPRRAGPPSRAAPSLRSVEAAADRRERRASGRATNTTTSASSVPSTATSPSCGREDEQAEREEHRRAARPRPALVERRDRPPRRDVRRSEREARQVDGEEARSRRASRRRRTPAPTVRATRPGRGPGVESRTR